jgi:thiol-activated cytolysin
LAKTFEIIFCAFENNYLNLLDKTTKPNLIKNQIIMTVSEFVDSLKYDPRAILVRKSNEATNYVKEEGAYADGKAGTYLVIKRKEKTIEDVDGSFPYIDAIAAKTFPGNLVLVNSSLMDNNPSTVTVARKDIELSIDLPKMKNPNFKSKVDKGSIDGAIAQKIEEWRKDGNTSVAARMDVQFTKVSSVEQLSTSLGLGVKDATKKLDVNFSSISSGKSTVWIAKFTQVYFNVFLKGFVSAGDLVDDSVTVEKLKDLNVSEKSPLGIVSSVAYGRQIFVKFETSDHSLDIEASLNLVVNSAGNTTSAAVKAAYQKISSKLSTKAVLYGGTANGGAALLQSVTIDNFYATILKNLSFGEDNVAVPIAYGVSFVKNGGQELAKVNSNTTYVETETFEYSSSKIHIYQGGAYDAIIHINWNEISYTKGNSIPVVTSKSWERNGKHCCAGQSYDIYLNGNARNLHINVKGCTGIVWDKTRTSFDRDVTITPNIDVKIGGTTLNQKCTVTNN